MDEKELKRELDETIGDSQQQLLIDVLEEIKRVNLITPKEKQEELQRLYEKVSKMTETKGDKLIEAVNDLAKITKDIKLDFPQEFKVQVLNQLKFPKEIKVSNWPTPTKVQDEIKLKKPDWYKQANQQEVIDALEDLIKAVKENKKPDLETYREPGKALAVRLVNRKGTDFYEALAMAMGSYSRGSFPFKTASGKSKEALVDEAGRIQIDIVSSASVISGRPKSFEDTSFVTGDSPVTLDVNTALGKNSADGYIINDGSGNFTIAISDDGANYGDEITMKKGEVFDLKAIDTDRIRITWIADSAYRVAVI